MKFLTSTSSLILFATVISGLTLVFGDTGISQLMVMRREVRSFTDLKNSLTKELVELNDALVLAKESQSAVEKKARENFGVVNQGEVMYIFPTKSKNR